LSGFFLAEVPDSKTEIVKLDITVNLRLN